MNWYACTFKVTGTSVRHTEYVEAASREEAYGKAVRIAASSKRLLTEGMEINIEG